MSSDNSTADTLAFLQGGKAGIKHLVAVVESTDGCFTALVPSKIKKDTLKALIKTLQREVKYCEE